MALTTPLHDIHLGDIDFLINVFFTHIDLYNFEMLRPYIYSKGEKNNIKNQNENIYYRK